LETPINTKEIRLILLTFVAVILVGTFLLQLPFAHKGHLDFIDALFTSTSATCVTGLIVKDTAKDFTVFGQIVILALIQVGGMGYMTIATFTAIVFKRKLSHRDQMILRSSLNYDTMSGVIGFLKNVFSVVVLFELVGALILAARFAFDMPFGDALWYGLFHSVSAFNNAGFSIFSDNLVGYKLDFTVNFMITSLIILGGIGYFVILELYHYRKGRLTRLSTHTKLTVVTTLILIVSGTFLFASLEWYNKASIGTLGDLDKMVTAYFYSVNLRTAGYNTIDLSGLTDSTLFLSTIYMVIGGGAGGTAGGVKVTVFAVIVIAMWHSLKGHTESSIFKRTIPEGIISQAMTTLLIASAYMIVVTVVLAESQKAPFLKILYEVASAFGTVGVSTGDGGVLSLSAKFNDFGKLMITLMMIAGRMGILAFTLIFIGKIAQSRYKYAEGRVII
jgi:trk system potassium uptake protein